MKWVDRWVADGESAQRRIAARVAWVNERMIAFRQAQERSHEAWTRMLDTDPDAEGPPPEDAILNAIWEELDNVRAHDRWPRAMHWGGI